MRFTSALPSTWRVFSGSLVGSAYHSSENRAPTKARTRSEIGPPTLTSNWVSQVLSYSVSISWRACAHTAWAIWAACRLSWAVAPASVTP